MSDALFLILFVSLTCLASAGFAWFLARRSTARRRWLVFLAALPLPGLVAGLCLIPFASGWYSTFFHPEHCGVDACGMAILLSSIGLFCSAIAYLIGLVSAWVVLRLVKKPPVAGNLEDVFE